MLYEMTLSVNNIQSKWSISCWITTALKPEYFWIYSFHFQFWYFTTIQVHLSTSQHKPGTERQASSHFLFSHECSRISGFTITVSQIISLLVLFHFLDSFRWVVAITRIFFHIWGAANPTQSYPYIKSSIFSQNSAISSSKMSTLSHFFLRIWLFSQVWSG